jgi:hypothetical protein
MTSSGRRLAAALLAVALTAPAAVGAGAQAAAQDRAQNVLKALDRIQAESLAAPSRVLRRSDFAESDFNAYIAYRLDEEKEDVLKELKLKLLGENRVEGMALVDLSGQRIPSFIKPRMSLYFEGLLIVQEGKARFDFRKLFLEGREIPLVVLDTLIDIAVRLGKTDAESIRKWVDLPYGIKDLKTRAGGISLYY